MNRLPTTKERVIESAKELLENHAALAKNEGGPCPCKSCADARELIEAFKEAK